MNHQVGIALLLAALCACGAVAVVYSTHLARNAYMEISRTQQLLDELDIRWSQLQLEQSTFSEHGRIERVARTRLGMRLPALDESEMIIRSGAEQ